MGPALFFSTNPDFADILGRTDLDFENFGFVDFLDPSHEKKNRPQPYNLAPATPSMTLRLCYMRPCFNMSKIDNNTAKAGLLNILTQQESKYMLKQTGKICVSIHTKQFLTLKEPYSLF